MQSLHSDEQQVEELSSASRRGSSHDHCEEAEGVRALASPHSISDNVFDDCPIGHDVSDAEPAAKRPRPEPPRRGLQMAGGASPASAGGEQPIRPLPARRPLPGSFGGEGHGPSKHAAIVDSSQAQPGAAIGAAPTAPGTDKGGDDARSNAGSKGGQQQKAQDPKYTREECEDIIEKAADVVKAPADVHTLRLATQQLVDSHLECYKVFV